MINRLLSACILSAPALVGAYAEQAEQNPAEAAIVKRSVVNVGDPARLQHVLAKAKRGEPIVIGAIGGSITEGAAASAEPNRWANLVAQWWRETFPKSTITFVNAGIGATGSDIGAHRVATHLLVKQPDFMMVEYAVNDPATQAAAETLEGLVRQALAQPNQPAVMLLFTMNNTGANAQEWHAKVGLHYGLPMVSYRDALWPEIQAGKMKWEDVAADIVHPNDRGHAYCATFIKSVLADALGHLPAEQKQAKITDLPKPLFTDAFEHTAMYTADSIKPVANAGWNPAPAGRWGTGWSCDKPGSAMTFEFEGTAAHLVFHRQRSNTGIAEAAIDDGKPVKLNGWFEGTWGYYSACERIASGLKPGKHRLVVTLTPDKSPESTGNAFQVQCILVGGTPTAR